MMPRKKKPAPEPWWVEGVEIVLATLIVFVPLLVFVATYRGVSVWELLKNS